MRLSGRQYFLNPRYPLPNSLGVFIAAFAAYWLTSDPGASYWDCPEYLIAALRLEIGHAPGNPGWALTHRFATLFFDDPATQVKAVNLMSGFFTALASAFLCSILQIILHRIWTSSGSTRWRQIAVSSASIGGALCLAWSDSAWYSAVEAEVYAMSLFLTALTVWMAIKWALAPSEAARIRWIVAIAYIIGFSIGVHQLNLLALPALALIMAFRSQKKVGFGRAALACAAGCVVVAAILKGLMPGSLALAGWADLLAVNKLGWPYWSGAMIFWICSIAAVVAAAVAILPRWKSFGVALWCLAAVMVGFSVYILIPLRAAANPPVNEGNPSDIFRLADYMDRRQYAKAPLLYGRTPFSLPMREERVSLNAGGDTIRDYSRNAMKAKRRDWRPMTRGAKIPLRSRFLSEQDKDLNLRLSANPDPHGYAVAGFLTEQKYTPELNLWFPRIHAPGADNLRAYGDWTGMDSASMARIRISEAFDSLGRPVARRDAEGCPIETYSLRPTYLQNLSYLFAYQIGYMYMRYLLWNFAGRQNDVPSTGEIDHGNFLTGLPLLDNLMLADTSALPPELWKENPGRNRLRSIPLLLGLAGMIWLFAAKGIGLDSRLMRRTARVSLVLFFMTGIAIVLYLNQAPGEPRERDYSFLGSFWVFAFWIGCGMLALFRPARRKWQKGIALSIAAAVPIGILAVNWDDHDRSHRSATIDYASNLLNSLDENAIIFVDGDNYIFPLWFAQEVMGVRRDVAVVCCAYLGSDWYVPQLMTPRYDAPGLEMTASEGDLILGNCNLVRLPSLASADTLDAVHALRDLYASDKQPPALGSRYVAIGRDSASRFVVDLAAIPGRVPGGFASLKELAALDIVATNAASSNPRPIYWQQNVGKTKYFGFYPFTRQALFTRKLAPEIPDSVILTREALDALPKLKWGGLENAPYPGPDVLDQAQRQRASLLHLADALRAEGHSDQALHVARLALVRFPPSLVPFSIRGHSDSIFFEARRAAAILRECGEARADSAAILEGFRLLSADSIRAEAFLKYFRSLPPSRRSALSSDSRNHSIIPKNCIEHTAPK